ncbi:MAG: hypothetical protein JWO25_2607 [Alphaproteobacteria bacterium]|nr:hypothetical protein [Alphaproteobacteria bacterium]
MHPSLALLALLTAAHPDATVTPGRARWLVQPGDNHCSLVRTSEDNGGKVLRYETHPGETRGLLLIVDPSLKRDLVGAPTDLQLMFDDSNDPHSLIEASGFPLIEARRRGFGLVLLAYGDVLSRIAASSSLTVKHGSKIMLRLRYAAGDSAAKALAECDDTVLKRWGFDLAFMASLRSAPIPNAKPGSWVADSDFPAGLERYRGTTVVWATVGRDGHLTGCVTVSSSGNDVLDRATCSIFMRKASYSPALDQNGAPVSAPVILRISWNAALD